MKTPAVCTFLCLLASQVVAQQSPLADSVSENERLETVVITATRTEKKLSDSPIPVSVIGAKEIQQSGMIRLNEILAEQTGLTLVSEHGTGIQMQGMDPDYTLILIDGQPLIGRSTGTLDLTRIAVANIARIEIVKGPSSSLYGSEALAGVINIITQKPKEGTSGTASVRYGSNNTSDLSAKLAYRKNKLSFSAFANRYGSDGYQLLQSSTGPTVPPFDAYTFNLKSAYQFNSNTSLSLSGRYYDESQHSTYQLKDGDEYFGMNSDGKVRDYNLSLNLQHRFSDKIQVITRLYHTAYKTQSDIRYNETGDTYEESFFDQQFYRPELQTIYDLNAKLKLTAGAGAVRQSVSASRYNGTKVFNAGYLYAQSEWNPVERINVVAGLRYDTHSEYQSQFSPKLSAQYKFSDKFSIHASAGRGYKAPDFRQLYLNFTNAVAGYSVFGVHEVKQRLQELDQQGQIAEYLIDPASISLIDAESSWAYNLGFRYRPLSKLNVSANIFRNNVDNLIETMAVAGKTNGQSVYSYFNLQNVYTQGMEANAGYRLFDNLLVSAGYQFLLTADHDVKNRIEAGKVFRRNSEGLSEKVPLADYGGLFNRSKHMANLKLAFNNVRLGFDMSMRLVYRGRYGFGDYNGNSILDADNEYVKGYATLNLSASKTLLNNKIRIYADMENLFDYTDPTHIATMPGRLFHVGLGFNLKK